jgi:hypothetical protein
MPQQLAIRMSQLKQLLWKEQKQERVWLFL